MKKFAPLALLLGLGLFTIGCAPEDSPPINTGTPATGTNPTNTSTDTSTDTGTGDTTTDDGTP